MDLEISAEERALLNNLKPRMAEFGTERSKLIPILQMIQGELSYLPSEAIELVAEHLDLSATEVYGVATFYNQFRFNPPGKYPIKVCLGTACHVRGGDIILENFERKLEIQEGETTPDREFSIERVACVGCCALAPVALIAETVHGKMAPSKVEGLLLRIQVEKDIADKKKQQEEF
jgi:NADH-quinone oxidoreductase subunit E